VEVKFKVWLRSTWKNKKILSEYAEVRTGILKKILAIEISNDCVARRSEGKLSKSGIRN
jgi:hypothetical protein